MHLEIKIEGLDAIRAQLDSKQVQVGVTRGLKKVGESTRTLASRLIRDEYLIKRADVDSKFSISANSERVIIKCSSRPVNLTYFNARQMGAAAGKRVTTRRKGDAIVSSTRGKAGAFSGVAAQVLKSRTTLIPGAFLAKVKAGNKGAFNIGVFIRKDKRRLPIINKSMVSVSTLFAGRKTMPALIEHVNTVGLKTIEHEVAFALGLKSAGPS